MSLEIGGRKIGPREPLFVIAELGLNHGGALDRALAMVDAAADAGVSAIKLQTFRAEDLVAPGCPAPLHVDEPSLQAFFRRFELDASAHRRIVTRARRRGVAVLATPFSLEAVDMLDAIGVDGFKIASGDITYTDLIQRAARTGRPLVLSTGMATLAETGAALASARSAGARDVALLHCVSAYPTPRGSENLRAIATLQSAFHTVVGLSDHGRDTSAVPIAVTLGASIYERHFMLPCQEGTDSIDAVDAPVSSGPEAFAGIVRVAESTQLALGHGRKECLAAEAPNVNASRRSLHAAAPLSSGHIVNRRDIAALRPATGLALDRQDELLGAELSRAVAEGSPFLDIDVTDERSAREVA